LQATASPALQVTTAVQERQSRRPVLRERIAFCKARHPVLIVILVMRGAIVSLGLLFNSFVHQEVGQLHCLPQLAVFVFLAHRLTVVLQALLLTISFEMF
jgi:hypothetical protein